MTTGPGHYTDGLVALRPGSAEDVPLPWQVVTVIVTMVSMGILSACLVRRLEQIRKWRKLAITSWLCLLVYADSILFVFLTAILRFGTGITAEHSLCDGAIIICLGCYVSTKVLIYLFLIEKAYIVSGTVQRRLRDKPYLINMFVMVVPYMAIIILNFIYRFAHLDSRGHCIIGMQKVAMIPLIAFDVLINVYLTALFVIPLRKLYSYKSNTGSAIRTVTIRTFVGSCGSLTSSLVNLTVLLVLQGEKGWICLLCCNADVLFSILVLHWVTAVDARESAIKSQAAAAAEYGDGTCVTNTTTFTRRSMAGGKPTVNFGLSGMGSPRRASNVSALDPFWVLEDGNPSLDIPDNTMKAIEEHHDEDEDEDGYMSTNFRRVSYSGSAGHSSIGPSVSRRNSAFHARSVSGIRRPSHISFEDGIGPITEFPEELKIVDRPKVEMIEVPSDLTPCMSPAPEPTKEQSQELSLAAALQSTPTEEPKDIDFIAPFNLHQPPSGSQNPVVQQWQEARRANGALSNDHRRHSTSTKWIRPKHLDEGRRASYNVSSIPVTNPDGVETSQSTNGAPVMSIGPLNAVSSQASFPSAPSASQHNTFTDPFPTSLQPPRETQAPTFARTAFSPQLQYQFDPNRGSKPSSFSHFPPHPRFPSISTSSRPYRHSSLSTIPITPSSSSNAQQIQHRRHAQEDTITLIHEDSDDTLVSTPLGSGSGSSGDSETSRTSTSISTGSDVGSLEQYHPISPP